MRSKTRARAAAESLFTRLPVSRYAPPASLAPLQRGKEPIPLGVLKAARVEV